MIYSYSIQTVLTFRPECAWFCLTQQQQTWVGGGLRTTGFSQLATAVQRRWVCHRRTVLVLMRCSVVNLCSLPAVCCLPGTCLGCVVVKRQKADDTTGTYVPIRSLVLKPGKSSHPLPPENKLWALATRFRVRGSRRDLGQCLGPGFLCRGTWHLAERCSYEEKGWKKHEKITNIRIHITHQSHLLIESFILLQTSAGRPVVASAQRDRRSQVTTGLSKQHQAAGV